MKTALDTTSLQIHEEGVLPNKFFPELGQERGYYEEATKVYKEDTFRTVCLSCGKHRLEPSATS